MLPGPDGGGVLVTEKSYRDYHPVEFWAAALHPGGRVLWNAGRFGPLCGNCEAGSIPTRAHPDGTFGPIADFGGDGAFLDRRGRKVGGCHEGVVGVDGTCIDFEYKPANGHGSTNPLVLRARRGPTTLWTFKDDVAYTASFYEATGAASSLPVVGDTDGRVFVAFGTDDGGGWVLGVDAASGAPGWRAKAPMDSRAVAATASGVLVATHSTISLYTGGATPAWTAPVPPRWGTPVEVDREHNLIYVESGKSVVALDAVTGSERWRSAPEDLARLLSLSGAGTAYLDINRGGARGLRAIGPDFQTRFDYPTLDAVIGARELADGTVIVSLDGNLAVRIDPARAASPPPSRPSVHALHRSFIGTIINHGNRNPACSATKLSCETNRRVGVILRFDLPTPATIMVDLPGARLLKGDPVPAPSDAPVAGSYRFLAPAGTSFARFGPTGGDSGSLGVQRRAGGGINGAPTVGATRIVVRIKGHGRIVVPVRALRVRV